MVDEAEPFPAVLERVVAWLQERELGTKYKYAILTDGYALTLLLYVPVCVGFVKIKIFLLLFSVPGT